MHRFLIPLLFALAIIPSSVFAQCKKNGKCTITDKDGFVYKGKMSDSLKTGVWKTWNEKKQLVEEITYVQGKESGPCKYYFPDDTSYTTGTYTNGKVDGSWSTYNSKGKLVHNVVWTNDTMNGPCFDYYMGHSTSGQYTKGKKTGWWVEADQSTGFCDSSFWITNKKDGRATVRKENVLRTLSYWKEGRKQGPYLEYDSVGKQTVESYFKNNMPDSIYRQWKNGILKSEYTFCGGGRYCGVFKSWKDDGKLDMITQYDSTGNRLWYSGYNDQGKITRKTWFNRMGQMDSISIYREDETLWYTLIDTGTTQQSKGKGSYQRFYYPDGKLQFSGYLFDSRRTGNWYGYDSTGKMQFKMLYEMGQLMGPFILYYPNGKPKLVTNCFEGYTDTIAVFDAKGKMVAQSDPLFNATIEQAKKLPTEVRWRNPNEFPAENGKKTRVMLGDMSTPQIPGLTPPAFPGGDDSLRAFIVRTVKFPETERRYNIGGEVKIRYSVNTDGSISDVQIVQEVSNGPGLTRQALIAVKKMPKWIPAKQNGQPVKADYILSVRFVLE